MKPRRHNWLFKEWYWGNGCGGQNLRGKTELEKIEVAFVEGIKVAHTAMSVGMKSAFVTLFRKDGERRVTRGTVQRGEEHD